MSFKNSATTKTEKFNPERMWRKKGNISRIFSLFNPIKPPYNNDRATSRSVSELYITLKMSLKQVELTSNDFKCLNLIFIRR